MNEHEEWGIWIEHQHCNIFNISHSPDQYEMNYKNMATKCSKIDALRHVIELVASKLDIELYEIEDAIRDQYFNGRYQIYDTAKYKIVPLKEK